ncbi:MAG: sulfite exporter TauE/SafE family protein [Ilumatobacteraceae bacterium]
MAIVIFLLIGAIAQLIDGTLGMAFGITSSSLLVAVGSTPVAASAAVHFAELGTTFASGASHWRARNVDWGIAVRIGAPGAVGAFVGATVLSRISLDGARTWMSVLLVILGLVLLLRFGLGVRTIGTVTRRPRSAALVPLGAVAGFVDASGGGGWGPITTPTLLTITNSQPRTVIGTVSAAEFFVAVAASGGFLLGSATAGVDWEVVAGLLLGGVLMAPFAAHLAGRLPHAPFGALIGGVVVVTNVRTLLAVRQAGDDITVTVLVAIALVVVALAIVAHRRERRTGVEHSFYETGDD